MSHLYTQQFFLEKLNLLVPEKQQELLDFAEFLVQKNKPKQSIECADLDVRDLKGILKRETDKVVSIEDMNVAIISGATEESS